MKTSSPTRQRELAAALLAGFLTVLVYLPSLRNDFVNWDDGLYVVDNVSLRLTGLALLWRSFTDFYAANWQPLTLLSHALDYRVWGLDPFGHHLSSILLHGLNSALTTMLAVRLIRSSQRAPVPDSVPPDDREALTAGLITGLLFGVHPLHVESVAWVSERKDVLCGFFFLLSLLAYLRYADRQPGPENADVFTPYRDRAYLASIGSFVLALLSKPMAISLPFVLLFVDWHPLRRNTLPLRSQVVEKAPYFLLSLASGVITLLAQASWPAVVPLSRLDLSSRVLTVFSAMTSYLVKFVWPLDLSPFYPLSRDITLASPGGALPVLFVAGVTTAVFFFGRRLPVLPALWGYYVITLLPVLGLVKVGAQSMADRYTYLPSLAPSLLVGLLAARGLENLRARSMQDRNGLYAGISAATAVVVALAVLTVMQMAVWKDSISLWTTVSGKYPGVAFARNNLGSAYVKAGRFDLAIAEFQAAIQLDPEYAEPHNNLAVAYGMQGRIQEAVREAETALRLRPDSADAHTTLGLAYLRLGRHEEAIRAMKAAIALKPAHVEAHTNLGIVYTKLGRMEDALWEYREVLRLRPDHAEAHNNRGAIYEGQGRIVEAIAAYRSAVRLNPDYGDAHYNLGCLYAAQGNKPEAAREFREVLRINPGDAEARRMLETL